MDDRLQGELLIQMVVFAIHDKGVPLDYIQYVRTVVYWGLYWNPCIWKLAHREN